MQSFRWALAIVLCAGCLAAQAPVRNPPWDVDLYLADAGAVPLLTLSLAEALASKMFATAGVRLNWNSGPVHHVYHQAACAAKGPVIKILFTAPTHAAVKSRNNLAYTYPYQEADPRIIIAYGQLPQQPSCQHTTSVVLAHILVHEVTHVLQRIDRHSDSGVMKAHWTSLDYAQMQYHPLPFEAEDLILIDLGRISWARSLGDAAGTASEQTPVTGLER